MILVTPEKMSQHLDTFFELENVPGNLRFYAVLQGNHHGNVWVDDLDDPRWGIIQELVFGTLYLQGDFPEGVLLDFITQFSQSGEVLYGCWESDTRYLSQLPLAAYDGWVWESSQRLRTIDLKTLTQQLPVACQLHPIDTILFPHIQDYQFYTQLFGSSQRALEQGFGFCLIQDSQIVCEAFAGTSHQNIIEIGVNTHEGYRQKGYATITCAALIIEAEQRGYQTYWNCSDQNSASRALAHRLGFRPMLRYRLLAW
ncbi:MAG: GNAT family N-acetyltransferase [Anaerolineae bacterium]|jgi:GNAT superfamily N-acetyltransferase|nr:GNAT family N-acetyltransferase [Anaerolineae bacterium]